MQMVQGGGGEDIFGGVELYRGWVWCGGGGGAVVDAGAWCVCVEARSLHEQLACCAGEGRLHLATLDRKNRAQWMRR